MAIDIDIQREINKQKEWWESVFLVGVLIVLWSIFWFSNMEKSPESIRYKKDIVAFTPNVKKNSIGLLSQFCNNPYDAKTCHDLKNGYDEAKRQIGEIDDNLNKKSVDMNQKIRMGKQSQIETNTTYESDKKMRNKALNLDDDGRSEAILKIKSFLSEANDTRAYLSAMAIADGNTAYKYSKLYNTEPEVATLMNNAALSISNIYKYNVNQKKAKDILSLLNFSGMIQFTLWSLVTLGMLRLSRRKQNPLQFIFIYFLVWTGAIWVYEESITANFFLIFVFIFGIINFNKFGKKIINSYTIIKHQISSRIAYPGFVFFIGIGLILMMDISSRGIEQNRFLIYDHFYAVLWGFIILSLAPIFSPLGAAIITKSYAYVLRKSIWKLNNIDFVISMVIAILVIAIATMCIAYIISLCGAFPFCYFDMVIPSNLLLFLDFKIIIFALFMASALYFLSKKNTEIKESVFGFIILLIPIVLFLLFSLSTEHNYRLSEFSKILIILFLALFLTLNGDRIIQKKIFSRMVIIHFILILIPILVLGIRGENGTLLVITYTIAIIVGGIVNYYIQKQNIPFGWHLFGSFFITFGLIFVIIVLIDNMGSYDDTLQQRLLSWYRPFESNTEDMARVHWFRESSPFFGYGFGNIPWGGYSLELYRGVPKQIQSDYTISALIGATGNLITILGLVLYSSWILRTLFNVWKNSHNGRISIFKHESPMYIFIAWSGLIWAIITIDQVLITFAGNVGLLPLTGITVPFISFGASSIWTGAFFFSLIINRPFQQTTQC